MKVVTGNRKKITVADVKAVADLVANKRLTIRESCLILNIREKSWQMFMSRYGRKELFEKYLDEMRGHRINNILTDIEKITNGDAAKNIKPDWRGKAFLLSVSAPDRFGKTDSPATVTTNNVNLTLIGDALKRVFEVESNQPKLVSDKTEPVAIPAG